MPTWVQLVYLACAICKPNPRFLYGAMGLQSEIYPRVLHIVRELSGAGVIGTPHMSGKWYRHSLRSFLPMRSITVA